MSGFIHFAIGGSRSGKSRRAESLAIATGQAVAYLATYAADPPDDEMRRRIERHRQQRPLDWRTIENRQMLDESVRDPQGVAGDRGILPGLNILPVQTTFSPTKSVSQVTVSWGADRWVAYQVHMGVTTRTQRCDELVLTVNGQGNEREGCRQNHVWGNRAKRNRVLTRYECVGSYCI